MKGMEFNAPKNAGVKALAYLKTYLYDIVHKYIKLGKDDPRKVVYSMKVSISLIIVSMVYYQRNLFDSFGVDGMWAVMTVVVVCEFTAGGTTSRSINRAVATALGGGLGYVAVLIAKQVKFGGKFDFVLQDIFVSIFIFIAGVFGAMTRFFPHMKAKYDYGLMIFLLSYSLVAVSGVRDDDEPPQPKNIFYSNTAWERLGTVVVGGAACIAVSIFISPVWSGQELHNLLTSNLEKLATFLEGFGEAYFQGGNSSVGKGLGTKGSNVSFPQQYKAVLNTKGREEALFHYAWWEPSHGRFSFRHPWKLYLKIGGQARECAILIEAMNHQLLHSDIKLYPELQSIIEESCKRMSEQSGKTLRKLAIALKTMTEPSSAQTYLHASKAAVRDLKTTLKGLSLQIQDLFAILPGAVVVSSLMEIVKCVEKISESVHELSEVAGFKGMEPSAKKLMKQIFPGNNGGDSINMDNIIIIHLTPEQTNKAPNFLIDPKGPPTIPIQIS